jgi:hypothetical protein
MESKRCALTESAKGSLRRSGALLGLTVAIGRGEENKNLANGTRRSRDEGHSSCHLTPRP